MKLSREEAIVVRNALVIAIEYEDTAVDAHSKPLHWGGKHRRPMRGFEDVVARQKRSIRVYRKMLAKVRKSLKKEPPHA